MAHYAMGPSDPEVGLVWAFWEGLCQGFRTGNPEKKIGYSVLVTAG